MFVISSLRTGTSFIYRDGRNIYIPQNETDIWRICPLPANTLTCIKVSNIQTPTCQVITPDCRCYTWKVIETAELLQGAGNCVYLQIPTVEPIVHLTWLLDYTYPTLPPGYITYQSLLYKRLIWPGISQDDYNVITAGLLCETASVERVLSPSYDLCEYSYTLNLSYLPGSYITFNQPQTVGKDVVVVVFGILLIAYTLIFLRHPRLS